jgi:hypothetical protein
VSVISSEWLEESELSSDMIHLDSPSLTIQCLINFDHIDALYNLVVGINIMSASLAQHLMKHMKLTPTTKLMKSLSGHIVPCLGILHIQPIQVEGTSVYLSFYVFPIWDFDLLIGQPFRRLLYKGQTGKINICFGKKLQFLVSISRSLSTRTESCLEPDPLEEFKAASLEFLFDSSLEDDVEFFIEEADYSEPEPLDEFA